MVPIAPALRNKMDQMSTDGMTGRETGPASMRKPDAHGSRLASRTVSRIEDIPLAVRLACLLFVFTIPFDTADIGVMSGMLSLSKIAGLVFFCCFVFYYSPLSPFRSFPTVSAAVWLFAAYILVYSLHAFLGNEIGSQFYFRLVTLIQLVVVFWILSSLLQAERFARQVLLTYATAAVGLAFGILLKVQGFVRIVHSTSGERIAAMGGDANDLGVLMALAALILIGLGLNQTTQGRTRAVLLACVLPLLMAIVSTSSRTAMSALAIGLIPYVVSLGGSRGKLMGVLMGVFVFATTVYLVAEDPVSSARWLTTYEEGKLAGRQGILTATLELIREKPFFGWGPVEFLYQLGYRTRGVWKQVDAHNLFGHLLLEVGVLGTVPFLAGIWLCVRKAWKARFGAFGSLPVALCLCVLSAGVTLTWLTRKPLWLVLALAFAAPGRNPDNTTMSLAFWSRLEGTGVES